MIRSTEYKCLVGDSTLISLRSDATIAILSFKLEFLCTVRFKIVALFLRLWNRNH